MNPSTRPRLFPAAFGLDRHGLGAALEALLQPRDLGADLGDDLGAQCLFRGSVSH